MGDWLTDKENLAPDGDDRMMRDAIKRKLSKSFERDPLLSVTAEEAGKPKAGLASNGQERLFHNKKKQ